MKTFKILFLGTLILFLTSYIPSTNCDSEKLKTKCINKLPDGFTYIKSYSLEGDVNQEQEFSFIFSKGVNYILTSSTEIEENPKIEVQLYDKSRKLLFSNYHKKKDKFYTVNYPCSYTGVHYIKFKNHSSKGDCGISVLAFKR